MVFPKIKNRKRKLDKVVVLLFTLFFLIYSFSVFFMINAQGNGVYRPIIYTFDENKLSDEIYDIPEYYNIEKSIYGYSDNYSEGYSMNESDIGSIPSFVSDFELSNYSFYNGSVDNDDLIHSIYSGSSEIVENVLGHYNVLNLSDNSQVHFRYYFANNLISETVEVYLFVGSEDHDTNIMFREGGVERFGLFFHSNNGIYFFNGSSYDTNMDYSINTWYHIRVQFDCNDKWYLWINNILLGNGYSVNDANYIDLVRFFSYTGYQANFSLDAFGCSNNSHYEIGSNYFPLDTFGQLEVIDNYLGHNNPLQFKKNKIGSHNFEINYENQTFGNVSFWMLYNPISDGFIQMRLLDENGYTAIWLSLYSDGIFKYYDLPTFYTFYSDYVNNTWIHLNIEFNSNTEKYNVYINDVLVESDIPYAMASTLDYDKISYFKVQLNPSYNASSYFDSFDCSWLSDYSIRDNLIPIKIYQDGYQMNNFELDYNSTHFENDDTRFIQSDDSNNNIYINKTDDYNSDLIFNHPNYINTSYDYPEVNWNFTLNGNYSRFQSKFELSNFTNLDDTFVFLFNHIGKIDDYDCRLHILIKTFISGNINIYVDNDFTSNVNLVNIGLLENNITYNFEVIFDFDNSYYRITLDGNGNHLEYLDYFKDISFNGFEGIHNLRMFINNNDNGYNYYLKLKSLMFKTKLGYNDFDDYTEYEYAQFQYNIGAIHFNRHNLFSIESISQNKLVFYNLPEFNSSIIVSEFRNQNGLETLNLWNNLYYNQAYLGFNIYGNFSLPTIYKIFGVKLVYEFQIAYPTYEYTQSDILTNYYYVNNSKLYYHFSRSSIPYQNEIMTISFPIDNYHIYHKDISYSGYITNNYQGSINISNTDLDLSKIYNLPNSFQTLNYTMVKFQDKNVNNIEISVKCSNDNIAQGYTDGYIESIDFIHSELLYDFPDIDDTIPDIPIPLGSSFFREGMMFTMLRIIVFLLPVLVGRVLLGNKAVVPLWLLMAIVLFIVGYIPFWMIIIQCIAIMGMIIIPKKEVDI